MSWFNFILKKKIKLANVKFYLLAIIFPSLCHRLLINTSEKFRGLMGEWVYEWMGEWVES